MGFLKHLLNNFRGSHHDSNHHGRKSRFGYNNRNPYLSDGEQECPSCKSMQASNAKFCANCGDSITRKICVCGILLTTGAKFCNNCGKPA